VFDERDETDVARPRRVHRSVPCERPEDLEPSGNTLALLNERQFLAFAAHAARRDMRAVAKAMKVSPQAIYTYLRQAEAVMGPSPNQVRRGQRRRAR
jgi:hypothetical protein